MLAAPGPRMVTLLLMISSPLVRVIVPLGRYVDGIAIGCEYECLPQRARSVVGGAGNRDRARVSILPAGYRQADQRKENKYRGRVFIKDF